MSHIVICAVLNERNAAETETAVVDLVVATRCGAAHRGAGRTGYAGLTRHLAGGARVILSGLLSAQAPSVIAAYRARGLVPVQHLRIEGWSSLLLRNTG